MTRGGATNKIEAHAPFIAGLMLALPVLLFRYPPMKDLASHEAIVALLRYGRDVTRYPAGLYTLNLGHPNQGFYALAWALALFLSTDTACKIIVGGTIIAIPVCAARLATHLGASRWAALVVAPVALGWAFFWGLAANLMGLAALLALLPCLDRLCELPTWRRALIATSGAFVLYALHESSMLVYAAASLLFAFQHSLSARAAFLRVTPALASGALLAMHLNLQRTVHTPIERLVPLQFAPLLRKFWTIPHVLFGAHDALELSALFGLSAVTLVSFAVARVRDKGASPVPSTDAISWIQRHRYKLLAVGCFVAYLVLPVTALHATLIYHRFLAPAYALLAISLSPRVPVGRQFRYVPLMAFAIPIATLAVVIPVFVQSSESVRDLDQIATNIEPGSAILEMNLGPRTTSVYSPYTAFPRVMAVRGGRMLDSFADVPTSPVVMEPLYQWPEPFFRILPDPLALVPAHDLTRFRYVLVRLAEKPLARALVRALLPEARLVAGEGDWLLFESTLPVVAPASSGVPLPVPTPPTLRARLATIW
jgi:hypothetical protein